MIRDFRDDDAAAVVALLREVHPTYVGNETTLLHRRRSLPPRAHLGEWVADEDGRVVGYASASLALDTSEQGVGGIGVSVMPSARRRRIGSALYERIIEHLHTAGARTAGAWAQPEAVAFLERRGHERRRSTRQSALDLLTADLTELEALERQKASEGFAWRHCVRSSIGRAICTSSTS
jgi:N-acetylglutamate synthase-like GNAT family acetyltransferase